MRTVQQQDRLAHTRIMASAGCGKTFQLANRYLHLLRLGADPATILASTFTRAAAAEIRDRILGDLAEAADNADKRTQLAEHTGGPINADESLDLLAMMTQQLHRLQIRTLDSFFSRIVRCFPFEIGIDPAASIVDEAKAQAMRQEAIRLTLDEVDPQPMIDLLRVLTEGSTTRRITDTIDDAVTGLYELYREAPARAWEAIQPVGGLLVADHLREAIETIEATPSTVDGHFKNAHRRDCESARMIAANDTDGWQHFIGRGLAKPIALGTNEFRRKPIEPEVIKAYRPLVQHARALCRRSVVQRTRSTRDLLERFDGQYRAVKAKQKAMTIADVTDSLLIGEAHDELAVPNLLEVYYRLDATLHHVLLDEMQDTSIPQWRVLHPIVEEIISRADQERTFFCVGDVKQSIYAWREACPEILESLDQLLGDPHTGESAIESLPLDKSYRSSQPVIDVVNRVFTSTASNDALANFPEATTLWDDAFKTHETVHNDRPGYVELRLGNKAEADEDKDLLRMHEAADLIAELHDNAPGCSIGVLMRRNRNVSRLLYELGPDKRNVPATAIGGGALTDAAPVNAILDLLRIADHPQHTIAAFNVMHSPLGPAVGLRHEPGTPPNVKQCRAVSRRVRQSLMRDGYAATIHEWINAIAESVDAREFDRLVQLEQLAARYDADATLRCDDFVRFVEHASVDDVSPAPVQVMTVHQSKGLQFDIVILPELEGELSTIRRLKVIADRDAPAGPIERIARHVGKSVWEMFDDLSGMLKRHETKQARESLSLLYVAMTRARYAVHMLLDPPRNPDALPATYAGVLRGALVEAGDAHEADTVVYEHGDRDWHKHLPAKKESETDAPMRREPLPAIKFKRASSSIPRGRLGASASARGHETDSLREQLLPQHHESRERGTALHALFEQITWLEDFEPDRDSLRTLVRRLAPRRDEAWFDELYKSFIASLEQPEVRTALSRGGRDPSTLMLRREFPYARIADGSVLQGYVDRLIVECEGGRAVRGTIIDFKSDAIERAEVEARADRYRTQMETYAEAITEIFGLERSAIDLTLVFITPGSVVPLNDR